MSAAQRILSPFLLVAALIFSLPSILAADAMTAFGIYNGLFMTTNGVTEQTAGMLSQLTVSENGTYSGALLINGGRHMLSGVFNAAGQATNLIPRRPRLGGPLLVEMTLSQTNSPPILSGSVFGTNDGTAWTANLLAGQAANTLPASQYTMLIRAGTNNSPPLLSPGGDGYALIANNFATVSDPVTAKVSITGALADGTAFNQGVPVSEDGYIPIYTTLYGGKGLLMGWINLLTNSTGVGLTWIHPQRHSGLYKMGFTNVFSTNQILVSPWTNASPEISLLSNLAILDTVNDISPGIDFSVTISDTFRLVDASDAQLLSGVINPRTGFFRFTVGRGKSRLTGRGAIVLNASLGGGYYLTKTNAQAILLQP